jgi:GT2 family glycosyltransferase
MNENTGGAGGFYYGVKFAYEDGADFIYLMDDDGKPYNETTFERIKRAGIKLYEENHLIFLNSLVTTNGTDLSFGFWPYVSLKKQIEKVHERAKDNIFMGRVNPFNGTLVSRELVEKIGYPRKEFFLSRDETDYMHRSVEAGATVATVIDSIYCHPSSKLECKKIGKLYVTIYQDLDREYYALRNVTYTYKDINKKRVIGICCIRFLTILLYEDQKVLRIKQIKIAVSDAKNNRMGKRGRK